MHTLLRTIILTFLVASNAGASTDLVKVQVLDCGPLAGNEKYGVVFSALHIGLRRQYVAEGNAYDVCPRITVVGTIAGTERVECILRVADDDANNERGVACTEVTVFDIETN